LPLIFGLGCPASRFLCEIVMRFALLIGLSLTIRAAHAAEQPTLARVTTYWREEGQFRAAWNGARLRNGHCAVDPKKIPYGSRIQLGDEELIAVDTGPAVVSRKAARLLGRNAEERNAVVVDHYFETKLQAVAWEKSHPHFMKMRVLSPRQALVISEKSAVEDRNAASQPIVAAPRPDRPPAMRAAIPIGDFYCGAFPGLARTTARDARRRTGGELVAANVVARSRARPLDWLRLLQIT
jgi:3D (Asp-Asp-Asp) domain-containing protein